MVGQTGFEPATPSPPDWCATKLRHCPQNADFHRGCVSPTCAGERVVMSTAFEPAQRGSAFLLGASGAALLAAGDGVFEAFAGAEGGDFARGNR